MKRAGFYHPPPQQQPQNCCQVQQLHHYPSHIYHTHQKIVSKDWFAHEKYDAFDFHGALQVLQHLHAANPTHIPTLLLLGCCTYSLGMLDYSIHYNNAILAIDPKFSEAYSNLGTTHRAFANQFSQQGYAQKAKDHILLAEQFYKSAIALRPKYWDACINLAGLLSAQHRYADALDIYSNIETRIDDTRKPADHRTDFELALEIVGLEKERRNAPKAYAVERRRDLYHSKGNVYFAMGDARNAKIEYFKALAAMDIQFSHLLAIDPSVLPPQMITPADAMVAVRNHQPLLLTASSILQTLGKMYQDSHQISIAIAMYYSSLAIHPSANSCNNLGILLSSQRPSESISWYEFGLSIDPNHAHLYTNLGSSLKDRGQVHEGIQCYQRAISIQPDFYIALANLANVFKDLNRIDEAIDLYSRALRVKPDFVEAFCNYVNSLLFICDWRDRDKNLAQINAIVQKQLKMIHVVPTVLPFHTFTYSILDAWAVREISRRNADKVLKNILMADWFPGFPANPKQISQEDSKLTISRALNYPYPYPVPDEAPPKLKIGYVSSDFNNHPLAHLMQSVFGFHDRELFTVYCYSLSPSDGSAYRHKIEEGCDVFVDVAPLSTREIVERILSDGIHILVNLNGYTKGGRNEIFAARPCPINMIFMGFAGTMGAGSVNDPRNVIPDIVEVESDEDDDADPYFFADMKTRWMDYMVTDELASPRKFVCGEPLEEVRETTLICRGSVEKNSDANRIYTEGLIYMPNTFFTNDHRQGFREPEDPEINATVRSPFVHPDESHLSEDELVLWRREQLRRLKMRRELFPGLNESTIIFANFNQLYKIDPEIFECWLRILLRVPDSILWLLRFPPAGEKNLLQKAAEYAGPEVASRIIFTDVAAKEVHIHRGRIADIFLDTPECNAHTTAADILWSGTPIITLPKYDFKMCSRVAGSVAYATGTWNSAEEHPYNGEVIEVETEKLLNPNLLGHWMVVTGYKAYENRAVMLASSVGWDWRQINKVSRIEPPTCFSSTLYPAENPEFMYTPTGFLTTLRRRLFLNRDTMPLFDTFRWTKNVETGMLKAWDRWQKAWRIQKKRNEENVAIALSGNAVLKRTANRRTAKRSRCIWI